MIPVFSTISTKSAYNFVALSSSAFGKGNIESKVINKRYVGRQLLHKIVKLFYSAKASLITFLPGGFDSSENLEYVGTKMLVNQISSSILYKLIPDTSDRTTE